MYNNQLTFSELLDDNQLLIRENMRWENYQLNETLIEVTEKIKDDAINVLNLNYGRAKVYPDILDDLISDVFVYFPVLLQQLAITRLIDSEGVVKDDINTTEVIRNEELSTLLDQNVIASQITSQNDTTTLNTQNRTTGTIEVEDDASNTQSSSTLIENVAGTDETGMRNVNLSHNMPEQGFSGTTGNFPVDEQGTPFLTSSYVQQATEGFTTSNPINSRESSEQTINNTNDTTSSNVTTNDINVANTGTNTRVVANNNNDTSDLTSETKGNNTITERTTSTMTNKQYAYEIKAFLETAQSTIAFKTWIERFSWIEGII